MKIAITGHRPNKLGNDYDLKSPLIKNIMTEIKCELVKLANNSNKALYELTLITGMALGIDTLFALIAIELNIPFIAAIPCFNQDKMWTAKSKAIYHGILANPLCKPLIISLKEYDNTVMQKRNEWMVDNCDILIAVWDKSEGGTNNCIYYALKNTKVDIIYISPKEIQL